MKYLLAFLLIVLSSCVLQEDERLCMPDKPGQKELHFADSLSRIFDTVEIVRYSDPNCDWLTSEDYEMQFTLNSHNPFHSIAALDSVTKLLAIELYSHVLEDSVIAGTERFAFYYQGDKLDPNLPNGGCYYARIYASSLAKYFGYSIEKHNKDFRQVFVYDKCDTISVFSDVYGW